MVTSLSKRISSQGDLFISPTPTPVISQLERVRFFAWNDSARIPKVPIKSPELRKLTAACGSRTINNHTWVTAMDSRLGKDGIMCTALLCSVGRVCCHWMLGLIQHSRRTEGAQQPSHLAKGPAIAASLETGGAGGGHLGSLYLSDWLSGQSHTVSEGKGEEEGLKRSFQSEERFQIKSLKSLNSKEGRD